MIYLDNGATSFPKPERVTKAVADALAHCANPGRGGYPASLLAAEKVLDCRENAARLFRCDPEQVVFTGSCTQGLNTAIRTLIKPGDRVMISGFEHNAVTRPLYALGAETVVSGRTLFCPEDTLQRMEDTLKQGVSAAVVTHCSNVFGYILPIQEIAELCKLYSTPLIVDAAQSAGILPVHWDQLGARFIAMPGHKGLLGPQGTGILLCGDLPLPLIYGGTGSNSAYREMPDFLPDRGEAGTLNVPGIAGLAQGISMILQIGTETIARREIRQMRRSVRGMESLGLQVFSGEDQSGTVSFLAPDDCEELAQALAQAGIAVRAGLHCAPLAHESAGTLTRGTVRVSFGHNGNDRQTDRFLYSLKKCVFHG